MLLISGYTGDMTPFDSKYWTFEQALAWVEFRRRDLVDQLSGSRGNRLSLMRQYNSTIDPPLKQVAEGEKLMNALREGRIKATGIPKNGEAIRCDIPAEDWIRLQRHGAAVFQLSEDRSECTHPWLDITINSAEVKKQWRGKDEVRSRRIYDYDLIRQIHDELTSLHDKFSDNKLMEEVELEYRERTGNAPSRSTIQRALGSS